MVCTALSVILLRPESFKWVRLKREEAMLVMDDSPMSGHSLRER
jgi:hypothetical protein